MAALISVDELNEFTGNYSEVDFKTTLVEAASLVVESYLRYSPLTEDRRYSLISWGTRDVLLPVPNASEIKSVIIDEETVAESEYSLGQSGLYGVLEFTNRVARGAEIVAVYTAGWEAVDIPAAIKHACLRIAALMLEEANGNIGVTGKTFADMSKNFISYTNYNKYLAPISQYRAGVL